HFRPNGPAAPIATTLQAVARIPLDRRTGAQYTFASGGRLAGLERVRPRASGPRIRNRDWVWWPPHGPAPPPPARRPRGSSRRPRDATERRARSCDPAARSP